jgi:hypothetical protein
MIKDRMTKNKYMKIIESKVRKKCGVGTKSLPTFNFEQYYEDNFSPQIAFDDFLDYIEECEVSDFK